MPAPLPNLPLADLSLWLRERRSLWREALEELVRVESPSGDRVGLKRCAAAAADWTGRLLSPSQLEVLEPGGVPLVRARTGAGEGPSVLLLGHFDTVWAAGSFQPLFELDGNRASGPGIFDMKGGMLVATAALAALQEAGSWAGPVTVVWTGDEEVGSAASRETVEEEARSSAAVLVFEPPAGAAVKIARKGVASYRLRVRGRAAHAGLEPERGVNAVLELAELTGRVASLADPGLGTSVTPTVVRGGDRVNVVPDLAELEVDVRFPSLAEGERVDAAMHSLTPSRKGASLELGGGPNRPPWEPGASAQLFEIASEIAAELGWEQLSGVTVGGGSDGNYTAAMGIPTLDGLGVVGGGAHAVDEWADLDSIAQRGALVAGCIYAAPGRLGS